MSELKRMILVHFHSDQGKKELTRGPYKSTWRNAAMSVALFKAAVKS